ncbi:hypothetical protein VP01_15364g1, partial [Puccinia sorghi]
MGCYNLFQFCLFLGIYFLWISSPNFLSDLFVEHVFSKHGLPDNIVTYRFLLFVSSFWTPFCQHLNIQQNLSTTYHTESNQQTERFNRILKQYLQ